MALSCYHALPFIVILGLKYVPWGGDEGAVDFGAEEGAEVAEVEGEEDFAAVGEGGDEDGFVFGGGEEERTFAGQGIGYPFQFGAQGRPICCCFVAEFADVAGNFGAAIGGGDKVPIALLGDQGDQAGQGFLRSAGRQNDAAVEKDSHAWPARCQKPSASRSSSVIHFFICSSGISRTGSASAG